MLPVNGMVKQREFLKHFGKYRKGGGCRIGLVIPDTPVSVILVLQSCKKHVNYVLLSQKTCCDMSPYW